MNSATAVILTQIPLIIIGVVGIVEFHRLNRTLQHLLKEYVNMNSE